MAAEKNRKSEAQERFEEADNAGRFAGNDVDAQAARRQAVENIRQDTGSSAEERAKDDQGSRGDLVADREELTTDGGEAQNVLDDLDQPLENEALDKARNKATEGQRQGRSDT